jgi:hypothetical protein
VDGRRATVRGRGTSNGTTLTFSVELDDAGPRADSFAIDLSSGYHAGGNLRSGRIEVGC